MDEPHSNVSSDREVLLAIALLTEHLRVCPNAADTILGISQWWLGSEAVSISPEALERALRHLVDAGRLATRLLPSNELLWYAQHPPTPEQEDRS